MKLPNGRDGAIFPAPHMLIAWIRQNAHFMLGRGFEDFVELCQDGTISSLKNAACGGRERLTS